MKTEAEQSEYLKKCLQSYYMAHRREHQLFYRAKRDEVIGALEESFADELSGKIIMSGSLKKSTELNTNFDVDLIIPFRHDAFTLETMSREVLEVLEDSFANRWNWTVRDQRVSVGLIYKQFWGASVKIDVVPGREIGLGSYQHNRNLKLFVSDGHTHVQTNIHRQLDALNDAPKGARNIIRLLKIWKYHGKGPQIKSFVLELLVIEAFKYFSTNRMELAEMLMTVLGFIAENMVSLRLVDPGNSGNIVSDLYSKKDKKQIARWADDLVQQIEDRPKSIKDYFPPNRQFFEQ
jgi:hypothetical protein